MRAKFFAPPVFAIALLLALVVVLQTNAQAEELDPPCPSNILAVAHHVGGWEDETRWLTPTWEGGSWVFSSTQPTTLTVPNLGKEDWLDYWENGSAMSLTKGSVLVTQASYHCVAPDWDVAPPSETPQPTPTRQSCFENCPACPASTKTVADAVGGNASQWLTPTWSGGSWAFESSLAITLTVPHLGEIDWLDWWNGKPISTTTGSIVTKEASYSCFPPELLDLPDDEIDPQPVSVTLSLPFLSVPMPEEIQSQYSCFVSNIVAAEALGGEYWEWQPPLKAEPWGAWVYHSESPTVLCIPPIEGQLDNWAFGSVTSGCFPQPVQDASYHCPD